MQRKVIKLVILSVLWSGCSVANGQTSTTNQVAALTQSIPPRPRQALTGSQFAEFISKMEPQQREQAILSEI